MAQIIIAYCLIVLASFTCAGERPTLESIRQDAREEIRQIELQRERARYEIMQKARAEWVRTEIQQSSYYPQEPFETWCEFVNKHFFRKSWLEDYDQNKTRCSFPLFPF